MLHDNETIDPRPDDLPYGQKFNINELNPEPIHRSQYIQAEA